MKEMRSISGTYRNIKHEYRSVSGAYRKLAKCYRSVSGVYRQYFGGSPISAAVIRLYQSTGESTLTFDTDGYSHGSSDDGFTARLILDLYDTSGNMISYTTLEDIAGLDTFELSVNTVFMIFYSGSGTIKDDIFGVSAADKEVWSEYIARAEGNFTVTKDDFTTKYIEIEWKGNCQRTVTFNYLLINGEEVPLTITAE